MGLEKAPVIQGGESLPADVVDKSGAQATFAASTTDYDGTNIRMHSKPTEKILLDTASTVTATAPLSSFGDAEEADVRAGKTFTGAAGLFKTGTGSIETVVADFTSLSATLTLGVILQEGDVLEFTSTNDFVTSYTYVSSMSTTSTGTCFMCFPQTAYRSTVSNGLYVYLNSNSTVVKDPNMTILTGNFSRVRVLRKW